MTIAERYGLTEEQVQRLIRDGLMNCTARKYELLLTVYDDCKQKGLPAMQSVANAAEAVKLSDRQTARIIKKFY